MAKQDTEDALTTDDKFALLLEALVAQKSTGIDAETLQKLLAGQATAMQKALKPENAEHPGYAFMAHPEGDKAKPREAVLTHEFHFNGFPVHKFPEAHTYAELQLAEQVQAGEYRVICKDQTDMAVTVTDERDAKGNVTKVSVAFPVTRETKTNVPPMYVLLYQLLHNERPERAYIDGMHAWLDSTIPA